MSARGLVLTQDQSRNLTSFGQQWTQGQAPGFPPVNGSYNDLDHPVQGSANPHRNMVNQVSKSVLTVPPIPLKNPIGKVPVPFPYGEHSKIPSTGKTRNVSEIRSERVFKSSDHTISLARNFGVDNTRSNLVSPNDLLVLPIPLHSTKRKAPVADMPLPSHGKRTKTINSGKTRYVSETRIERNTKSLGDTLSNVRHSDVDNTVTDHEFSIRVIPTDPLGRVQPWFRERSLEQSEIPPLDSHIPAQYTRRALAEGMVADQTRAAGNNWYSK